MNLTVCEPGKACCATCDRSFPVELFPLRVSCQQCDCDPCVIEQPDAEPVIAGLFSDRKPPVLTLRRKLINFAFALWRHAKDLFRRRPPWEVARIHAICEACPEYIPATEGRGSCKLCGCPLARGKVWRNKIAARSEHCPMDPPKW